MTAYRTYLRRITFLKNGVQKYRDLKHAVNDFIYETYYGFRGKKIIHGYFARVNNFGDLFNYDLLDFFGYKLIYVNNEQKSKVALLGSILQMYTRNFEGYILGSGFIDKRFSRIGNKWKVKIMRGPLSLKQCNPDAKNIVFADPGILADLVYGNPVKKKYKLGIVPHASDYDAVKNKFGRNILVIKAKNHPRKVARQIQQCQFIASSSLHGLIFADSYRIPNIHLKFGDRLIGGHHKFQDYYLGMDVKTYDYIFFDVNLQAEAVISHCKLRYSKEKLQTKQQEIIRIYTKSLKEIKK